MKPNPPSKDQPELVEDNSGLRYGTSPSEVGLHKHGIDSAPQPDTPADGNASGTAKTPEDRLRKDIYIAVSDAIAASHKGESYTGAWKAVERIQTLIDEAVAELSHEA